MVHILRDRPPTFIACICIVAIRQGRLLGASVASRAFRQLRLLSRGEFRGDGNLHHDVWPFLMRAEKCKILCVAWSPAIFSTDSFMEMQ